MADYNRVILLGRLTRDVELKYTPSNMAVTDIGMAVSDRRKNQTGEWVEETTFVDVTLWGRTAEVASEYLSKGSPVFIEGRLKLDTWDDKQSGQKRSKLRVVGERLQLIGSRNDRQGGGGGGGGGGRPSRSSSEGDYGESYDAPPSRGGSGGGGGGGYEPPRDDVPF